MDGKKLAKANKTMLAGDVALNLLLFAAYILEYVKGSRGIGFTIIFAVLTLGPTIFVLIVNKKEPENGILKHFIPISFGVLSAAAMFTSNNKLPFSYCIAIFICMMLYQDAKYMLRVGILTLIVNIVDVVYKFTISHGLTIDDMADVEIRILLMLMITILITVVTKAIKDMNDEEQEKVIAEKEKTENLLGDIVRLSDELVIGAATVDESMIQLAESTETMHTAMSEVAQGNQETADSIQNQLIRTEDIQKLIDGVSKTSESIMSGMNTASEEVSNGMGNMEKLSNQAVSCTKANSQVVALVNDLQEQTTKMNEIITMITSIANSTGMLALNASIEAARAGEAGRGFAVVATQVSNLADQTKGASANITDLIETVVNELGEVVKAVEVLSENTKEEEAEINDLRNNLKSISDLTYNISSSTKEMEDMVARLAKANEDIVSNIQTISAVTEEVTARSSETMDTCDENKKIVAEVLKVAESLNESAKQLKYSN